MPPAPQPMTDPFAFVRAPLPMAGGGLPTIPNSTPPPMQAPLNAMYPHAGGGLPPQPQTLEGVAAAPPGPVPSSVPGVTLFTPNSTASSGAFPVPGPTEYTSHGEQSYFNSREQTPSMASEPPTVSLETLAGDKNKAVNGIPGSYQPPNNPQIHSGHAEATLDCQGASPQDHPQVPYMNDGTHASQGNTQKTPDSHYDHVENLECVPNQEVLPSDTHGSPAAIAPAHGVDQFETGPNLETPDSVPRPMRSASVSSNFSNMSHGSGTSGRRHQGVVGTFIQQESPRLTDDANLSAAAGGYFEQIDTSPAGDMGARQSSLEQMWPPTPSPPKPTGIFQASANSSFEPVRSHGVGVRPVEVDVAKIVAEEGADSTPGNLEQPPDNMENIYGQGHPLPAAAGGGVPHLINPVVLSHSRPSSRAYGANRPCDSPATTLWAQNDPASLGSNILLAPAAPTVLAPLREPSADVIQPPEDGPLDLQSSQRVQITSQQHSENLENPPKVSEAEPTDSQGNMGYASLLVSDSLHQPVLIAPPVSNYNVIHPSTPTQAASQISHREPTPPVRSLSQGQGASTPQSPSVASNLSSPFATGPISFNSSASNQSPLNLTRDNKEAAASEITASLHPPPVRPPLSRGQSDSHSALQANTQTSLMTAPVSNHNQPSNYELLDFSMHQSQTQNQASGHPSSLHESPQSSNGFYLQVTKDAQQGVRMEGNAPVQTPASSSTPQVPPPPAASQETANPQLPPTEPPKTSNPQAALQGQGGAPPVPVSRAQPSRSHYPPTAQGPAEGSRADPWYGRYDGQTQAYRDPNYQYRETQPERPSSRASQYSDRPSSRQGYPDDYQRTNRSAYSDYYAEYSKNYDYRGMSHVYLFALTRICHHLKDYHDDQWRYYPGYDPSFDEDYHRRGEMYGDDFDRRSVHSEQSAHSVHSSHSHHSRRSSFSSRSQQVNTFSLCSVTGPLSQTDVSQNYSQYIYPSEYTADSTWIAPEQPPPRPATPEKFTIPHRCARFGPGGHLIQVLSNLPSAGQPALVDIHNMETMLQDTPDQAELRAFPGPLVKEETHKVDVIKFSQNKAVECSRDNNLLDRDSARLLWDFIVLLCRQNGTVVGTDIADLLLKEHRSVWLPGKSPNEANLIDFNNEPLAQAEEDPGSGPLSLLSDTFMTVPENVGKETERFRELLLFGRKKDALEAAMKGGLWGHALLLASKMDNRTHARVMTRFANSLPINDPLQTVYQLMSGRMPASATCCGEEKWGDWRPHLAMVLSNLTHTLDLDTRTITTMGDTLASKGLIDAAHFCYLMAQVGLGVYTKKSTKMVLIGSNHSLSFCQFATNEAIQRTEAYEYAQSLGSQPCSLPNFQVFKLIYACRLAEAGLSAQAFHYCEAISRTVLMQPSYYSAVFISQIIQMSEKLRFFDPQLKEKPEQEWFNEPEWLIHLRQLDGQIRVRWCSLLPGPPPQGVQLMPPGMCLVISLSLYKCICVSNIVLLLFNFNLLTASQLQNTSHLSYFFSAPTSILQEGMAPPQTSPVSDVPQFYPVPPTGPPGQIPISGYSPQDPGFAHPPFQPHHSQPEMYPGAHEQPCSPHTQMGQMSPHMPPQMPHSPVQMAHPPPQMPQHMPPSSGHMPPVDHPHQAQPEMQTAQPISSSPPGSSFPPQMDLYDHMGKSEAHLPDDKNKSIVWDEQKKRWVDLNEPEEESKPPPPPPSGFPKMAPMPGPGGPAAPPSSGPPVNIFSRKAGTKSRYVDVLNPSRTAKPGGMAPAPPDMFAPLAPMPMPTNLFVPSSGVPLVNGPLSPLPAHSPRSLH
uniref:Protein transport protein sec16 n=1 Tax=Echeneis naucrates TaxID=173247 RepID=A0A665W588_ECHNA